MGVGVNQTQMRNFFFIDRVLFGDPGEIHGIRIGRGRHAQTAFRENIKAEELIIAFQRRVNGRRLPAQHQVAIHRQRFIRAIPDKTRLCQIRVTTSFSVIVVQTGNEIGCGIQNTTQSGVKIRAHRVKVLSMTVVVAVQLTGKTARNKALFVWVVTIKIKKAFIKVVNEQFRFFNIGRPAGERFRHIDINLRQTAIHKRADSLLQVGRNLVDLIVHPGIVIAAYSNVVIQHLCRCSINTVHGQARRRIIALVELSVVAEELDRQLINGFAVGLPFIKGNLLNTCDQSPVIQGFNQQIASHLSLLRDFGRQDRGHRYHITEIEKFIQVQIG